MADFKFKNPLRIALSNVLGDADGTSFTAQDFDGSRDEIVTISLPQAVGTTSNVEFATVISSDTVNIGSGKMILSDRLISGSVYHTGSITISSDLTGLTTMSVSGQVNAAKLESNVTQSFTVFESGSTKFGDDVSDVHNVTGSLKTSGSFVLNGYSVNEISNDTSMTDESTTAFVTENAMKDYINTEMVGATYVRKSFVHTGSYSAAATSSFTAVTASAPSGYTATSEEDFMFFVNGMLIEHDAMTLVQKTSTNLELRLDTSGLGYELESDDEVIGFGKFNS